MKSIIWGRNWVLNFILSETFIQNISDTSPKNNGHNYLFHLCRNTLNFEFRYSKNGCKWSFKYLNEYSVKRDFPWVFQFSWWLQTCRYAIEEIGCYYDEYSKLRAHIVRINRRKGWIHMLLDFLKISWFFKKSHFFNIILQRNHLNLRIKLYSSVSVLWQWSILFLKGESP